MTFEQWWKLRYDELSMRSSPITKVHLEDARQMAKAAWNAAKDESSESKNQSEPFPRG